MGRRKCNISVKFTYLGKTPNKKLYFVECKACRAARTADPGVPKLKSRSVTMERHIKKCEHCIPLGRGVRCRPEACKWTDEIYVEFVELLVRFQACLNLPDTFIEKDVTKRLFEFLNPGISLQLPDRRKLGRELLDAISTACREQDLKRLADEQARGGRVNLMSDVWQNVSKQHLMACQLSLFDKLYTYVVEEVGSSHDGVTIAKDLERVITKAVAKGWDIGAVITDDAGQSGRARRILALRFTSIVFLRCFAHNINNLVRAVLQSSFKDVSASAAKAVNTLNASSAKWLKRAYRSMIELYGKKWSLLTLCETRWNSMQACFASLLRVKTGLRNFYMKWKDKKDFPPALRILGDHDFWKELSEAEEAIRPLLFASYKLQQDKNTLADVVDCYASIYLGFARNKKHGKALVQLSENRCEQPRSKCPHHIVNLANVCVYYNRRLNKVEKTDLLFGDFVSWRFGTFTTVPVDGFRSFTDYWHAVKADLEYRKVKSQLPDFALMTLSIGINTATCERLFSDLGTIHTAMRNQLKFEKTLKIQAVRQNERERAKTSLSGARTSPKVKRLVCPTEKNVTNGELLLASMMADLAVSDNELGRDAFDKDEGSDQVDDANEDFFGPRGALYLFGCLSSGSV